MIDKFKYSHKKRTLFILLMLFHTTILKYDVLYSEIIIGKIYEIPSYTPISTVTVTLLNAKNKIHNITYSDSLGCFSFNNIKLDSFKIITHRFGYVNVTAGPYSFNNKDTLLFRIELEPIPFNMDSISITAKRLNPFLNKVGFYKREKTGLGKFIYRDKIENISPRTVLDIIQCVPGMLVRYSDGQLCSSPTIYSIRYYHYGIPAQIFIDGNPTDNDYIELLPPDDIMAIEVYKNSINAPIQYGFGKPGGVILIWTRH